MTTHGPHLAIRPSVVVSDPKSHDLEINKHDPFGLDYLEPPDCDTWQIGGLIHLLKDKYLLSKKAQSLLCYAYLT